jgi:subtilisin family serine protease
MYGRARVLVGVAILALAGCQLQPASTPEPALAVWRAPARASEPEKLRVVPAHQVARLGETASLRIEGAHASRALCVMQDRQTERPPRLEVPSPEAPGVIDVLCGADGVRAAAQVTFTAAESLPLVDPYAGGVVLFKLRRPPRGLEAGRGSQSLGLRELDRKLQRLDVWAMQAFPFARADARDAVGMGRWIVLDIPETTNFYQAVAWIRSDPDVESASYLPAAAAFLRVRPRASWPTPFVDGARARHAEVEKAATQPAASRPASGEPPAGVITPDLERSGAVAGWDMATGRGVGIAIVDTGIDVNHAALAPNLMSKPGERSGGDADGNGIPGDELGANFAHLAIARGESGPPVLALGSLTDLSDWDGALEDRSRWGHGTQIASIAAGAGGPGVRLGVAPRASLIAVDVQENLRVSASRLLQEDPRLRRREQTDPGLRSSVWARAAGIVYAVTERARVLTCAWSEDTPHWLLHDALRYAEDNCVIPVCAVEQPPGPLDAYPAQWRHSWLERHTDPEREAGAGPVLDLWTGELHEDRLEHPLLATLVAGSVDRRGRPSAEADEVQPDLFAPTGGVLGQGGVAAALSNPRNDATPGPDQRTGPFAGPAAAAGMIAGTAALLSELRPDLTPVALREALLGGMTPSAGGPLLNVVDALHAARSRDVGSCASPVERRPAPQLADEPWWKRLGRRDDDPGGPASPQAQE